MMADGVKMKRSYRKGLTKEIAGIACLCLVMITFFRPASAAIANETAALLGIKEAWGNPQILSSWRNGSNPCTAPWEYVGCDVKNSTITELLLYGGNVNASLPESIAELVNLETLAIQGWGLTGRVPSTIGSLANLTEIILSENIMDGPLPSLLGNLSKLQSLSLDDNSFSGELPVELSKLTRLTYLNLAQNHLAGSLPSWIGNFQQLTYLNLAMNSFQGDIPPQLGNLSSLVNLSLTSAGHFSSLPSELENLRNLSTLFVEDNNIPGNIPDSYGNFVNLTRLSLAGNALSGPIPDSLGNLTTLNALDLSSNSLSSSIPATLGNLVNLQELYLQNNALGGPIPQNLSALFGLIMMDLSINRLNGQIPTQLGQLSNLNVLSLNKNQLSGPIPSQLTELENLKTIDLSGNMLSGPIPSNLTKLPNLTEVNLGDNCLNGTVPTYNMSRPNLQVVLNGANCFNASQPCTCGGRSLGPPSANHKSSNKNDVVYIAIGVVTGSFLALMGLSLLIYYRRKRRTSTRRGKGNLGSHTYRAPVRQYTLAEVLAATDNLTTKVGEGGYATVYKGVFKDGTVAAVKHFNKKKPTESFEQEVEFLSHLSHRFLVNLKGYCEEAGELMLMYDFMDRGNLFENLHGKRAKIPLTWDERVKIIISVARGIEYLHYGTSPPMIHRDIKSANILLATDGKTLNAKLADFGMGKQTRMGTDEVTVAFGDPPHASPTRVAGTAGYMDPEYAQTSLVSVKSDVYSYGVVLLELLTGKPSIFMEEERTSLASWAKQFLGEDRLWSIVDPTLGPRGSYPEDQLLAVAAVARHCIEHDHRNRPTMNEIMKFFSETFGSQTIMIDPSLRSVSTEDYSSHSTDLILSHLKDLIADHDNLNSMEFTHSEVLPRD